MPAVYPWNHLFSILNLLQFWFQNSSDSNEGYSKVVFWSCDVVAPAWTEICLLHNAWTSFKMKRKSHSSRASCNQLYRLYLQIFRANKSCCHEFSLPWFLRETLIASKWFKASLTRLLDSWKVFARCCWSSTYSSWLHHVASHQQEKHHAHPHAATAETTARTFTVLRLRSTRRKKLDPPL